MGGTKLISLALRRRMWRRYAEINEQSQSHADAARQESSRRS